LNPNQLARRRAHDREAQRNIRQRTQDHIEKLRAADTGVVRRSTKWQESRSCREKKYSARGGGRTSKGGAEWTFDSFMRIQSDSLQMVWGKLRDILINDQEKCATEEFIHLYCISININWPIRDVDVFCFDGAELRVTEAFATHATTLSNWSLDEPFQRRYPE
jgi:hypothetical protein